MSDFDTRPIGVFDSGIGGLTVLKELTYQFPEESFIYVGDTARLPYGSKSLKTIRKYSEQIIKYLISQNVKAIVVACNTASSQVTESEYLGIPIYNVITPGAERALEVSKSKRIGVIATRATINSQAYTKTLTGLNPNAQVFDQACPMFVPLAEEGMDADPVTNLMAVRYIMPLLEQNIDTLVMGCTHYPILVNSISRVTGSSIELVDPAHAIARLINLDFVSGKLKRAETLIPGADRTVSLFTTDSSESFIEMATRILRPVIPTTYEVIDI